MNQMQALEKLAQVEGVMGMTLSPGPMQLRVTEIDRLAAGLLLRLDREWVQEDTSVGELYDLLDRAVFLISYDRITDGDGLPYQTSELDDEAGQMIVWARTALDSYYVLEDEEVMNKLVLDVLQAAVWWQTFLSALDMDTTGSSA